jgi:hypothetical protein
VRPPDRVPVFSCTEAQNQVYEILGQQGSEVPLSSVPDGLVGFLLKRATPVVNALGILTWELRLWSGSLGPGLCWPGPGVGLPRA